MSNSRRKLEKNTDYFILTGLVNLNDPVSGYRLIDKYSFGRLLNNQERFVAEGLRVSLPAGTVVERWTGDGYATTECKISIKQLSPMPVVNVDGKKREFPGLLDFQPHEWYLRLIDFGLRLIPNGYVSREKQETVPKP